MIGWIKTAYKRIRGHRTTVVVLVGAHVFRFENVKLGITEAKLSLSKKQLESIFSPSKGVTTFGSKDFTDDEIQNMIGSVSVAEEFKFDTRACRNCGVPIHEPTPLCGPCNNLLHRQLHYSNNPKP